MRLRGFFDPCVRSVTPRERHCATRLLASIALLFACTNAPAADAESMLAPPDWAFVINPPPLAAPVPEAADATPRHVPGSSRSFTLGQVRDRFAAPDWHPQAHPPMPAIVATGRAPDVYACGFCHLPNGQGRPENSRLAGLPFDYIVAQMADFKSGMRKSSEPKHVPSTLMVALAGKVSDAEIRIAARYFSALEPAPWIRVVETGSVPSMRAAGFMLVPDAGNAREPIGERIVETAASLDRTELRDDASGFIVYVPVGSIARGRELVTTGGGGKTLACASCHGADLRGLANVPSIAGRSPSYVVRQLCDLKSGNRAGQFSGLMRAVVRNLGLEDLVAIAAYTASLPP